MIKLLNKLKNYKVNNTEDEAILKSLINTIEFYEDENLIKRDLKSIVYTSVACSYREGDIWYYNSICRYWEDVLLQLMEEK